MRKLIVVVTVVIFGVVLLGVSVASQVRPSVAIAEMRQVRELMIGGDQEATGWGEKQEAETMKFSGVDYYLPYPGILPDHPLYFVKMIRDRVMLWLMRQPKARLERLLLYADKRIGAAKVLAEGNKPELAVATATKAEKYLEQVVEGLVEREEKLEGRAEFEDKLRRALLKHQEVLSEIRQRVGGEAKLVLDQISQTTEVGYRRLIEMSGGGGIAPPENEIMENAGEATASGEEESEGAL